jgi:hypothetical protein
MPEHVGNDVHTLAVRVSPNYHAQTIAAAVLQPTRSVLPHCDRHHMLTRIRTNVA